MSFRSLTVGLSFSPSDAHLLRYAAMLAAHGLGGAFHFLHVVVPHGRAPHDVDRNEIRQQMEAAVAADFPAARNRATFEVRVGVRVDEFLAAVQDFPGATILIGHRRGRCGKRSLAQRLAMLSPCSVWMVPEQAPLRLERVLAPVDFSPHSAASLERAIEIARRAESEECAALHVAFDPSTIRYDEREDDVRGREATAYQAFLRSVDVGNVAVTPVFDEDSNVTRAILRTAEARGSDLIVMSTRGRSRAASILLGSETAQTLAESPLPVLAIKHGGALNVFDVLMSREYWSRPTPKTN